MNNRLQGGKYIVINLAVQIIARAKQAHMHASRHYMCSLGHPLRINTLVQTIIFHRPPPKCSAAYIALN